MNENVSAPMTIHDWYDGPYPARVRIAIDRRMRARPSVIAWARMVEETRARA